MHDLVIKGGTVVDGTGAPARTADVAVTDGRITEVGEVDGRGAARDRRRRPARHARLRRHPHALRRSGHVGPAAHAVVLARRHHGRDGQLRRRLRARRARPSRLAHRADGRRRGHSRRRAVSRHPVGVGVVPRVPRHARPSAEGDRHRHAGAARRGARVRDGGARRAQRAGDGRRHRSDGGHRARRHRGRRARLLDVAHARAPRHRRRAGAGHVRRGGRAVRHRPRARRARHRRVRARACGRARARTSPRPRRRWTGCGGCRRPSAGR